MNLRFIWITNVETGGERQPHPSNWKMKNLEMENQDEVSVIIPVYNDPDGLHTTIDSLLKQSYSRDLFEILIIDNGSDDTTWDQVKSYSEEYPKLIDSFREATGGSYRARNRGIAEADGDFLAFIDSDMTVDDNWIELVVQTMNVRDCYYLGCAVEVYIPENSRNIVSLYDHIFGLPVREYLKYVHFAPTCSLVVISDIFEEIGRFDSRLVSGADHEFGVRVFEKGYEQYFASDITMYHPARTSVADICRKNIRIGRGIAQKSRFHPELAEIDRFSLSDYLPKRFKQFKSELQHHVLTGRRDEVPHPNDLSFSRIASLYLIDYFSDLCKMAGMWMERVRATPESYDKAYFTEN